MGVCPDIGTQISVMMSAYESSRAVEGDIHQALARAARARIAEEQALSLSQTLGSDLDTKVKQQVWLINGLLRNGGGAVFGSLGWVKRYSGYLIGKKKVGLKKSRPNF